MKQLNIPISEQLHQRLKVQAAKELRTVTAIVSELVEGYVLYQEKSTKQPVQLHEVSVVSDPPDPSWTATVSPPVPKPKMNLSKAAQAKGKMGR